MKKKQKGRQPGRKLTELPPDAPLYAHKIRELLTFLGRAPSDEAFARSIGTNRATVLRWANGEQKIGEMAQIAIAHVYDVPLSYWTNPDEKIQDVINKGLGKDEGRRGETVTRYAPGLLYSLDAVTLEHLYVNPKAADLVGMKEEEVYKLKWDQIVALVDPADQQAYRETVEQIVNEPDGTTGEIAFRIKGQWFRGEIAIATLVNLAGDPQRIIIGEVVEDRDADPARRELVSRFFREAERYSRQWGQLKKN